MEALLCEWPSLDGTAEEVLETLDEGFLDPDLPLRPDVGDYRYCSGCHSPCHAGCNFCYQRGE